MPDVQAYLKPNELKPLHALLLAHQQALVQAERTKEALSMEQRRLLDKWQPKAETLREKADIAEDEALDRDEPVPDTSALQRLEELVDALDNLDVDSADDGDLQELLEFSADG